MASSVSTLESVTDSSFAKDVIESDLPVIVDFWAEWCGPCRMIAPVLEEVAAELNGKIKIVKLNIDQNSVIPAECNVRSIPTLALFHKGKIISSKVGSLSKNKIIEWVNLSV